MISNFQIKFGKSLELLSKIDPIEDVILKWNAGVLADNGKIYGSPYRASGILEIDPSVPVFTVFGSLSTEINKWYNITKANDGKLYCIPTNISDILEIDPVTHNTNLYPGATSPIATKVKWPDAILADNGKIYGIPNRAQDVIEFDPNTKGIVLFGGFTDNISKWSKPVLGSDGKIYAGPILDETTILEIDPTGPSAIARATTISGTAQYNETVFSDGKVFLGPLNATGIGVFNITTKAFYTIGNFPGINKINALIKHPNGKIYCIPRKVTYIIEIDPVTEDLVIFGNVGNPDDDLKWNKAAIGGDGMIYALPAYRNGKILKINPYERTAIEFGDYLKPINFHWSYCVTGNNGNVYGIPNDPDTVLEIIA